METTIFTPAQQDVLRAMSFVKSEYAKIMINHVVESFCI